MDFPWESSLNFTQEISQSDTTVVVQKQQQKIPELQKQKYMKGTQWAFQNLPAFGGFYSFFLLIESLVTLCFQVPLNDSVLLCVVIIVWHCMVLY